MAVDKPTVVLLAPELASVSDALFALAISYAAQVVDVQVTPPSLWEQLSVLYIAHWLTVLQGAGGAAGALTGETVGGISRQYAAPAAAQFGASGLQSSKYGRLYLALCEQFGAHFFVT